MSAKIDRHLFSLKTAFTWRHLSWYAVRELRHDSPTPGAMHPTKSQMTRSDDYRLPEPPLKAGLLVPLPNEGAETVGAETVPLPAETAPPEEYAGVE